MIPSSPHYNTNGKNNKNGGGSNNSNKKVATMSHPLAPARSDPPVRPGAASLPTITFCRVVYNCCWHACVCVVAHGLVVKQQGAVPANTARRPSSR
jgi:hypothetical protein